MKKLSNLRGAQTIDAKELKTIHGGRRRKGCPAGGDPECCGTNFWQCGVGPGAGGILLGDRCECF